MYKVRMNIASMIAVVENGQEVVKKCFESEDVFVKELNAQDIKNNVYRPYKHQIVSVNGEVAIPEKKRQRPEYKQSTDENINFLNEIKGIKNDILAATSAFEKMLTEAKNIPKQVTPNPKTDIIPEIKIEEPEKIIIPNQNPEIPDEAFIEEGEVDDRYTQKDYESYHNRVRGLIPLNIEDTDHEIRKMSTAKHMLPKFAKVNVNNAILDNEIEGSVEIENTEPILQTSEGSVGIITLIKDDHGRVDPFASLGAKMSHNGGLL